MSSRVKDCTCHTCGKDFHHLGIARHRAMHRDRQEDCEITMPLGGTIRWRFSKPTGRRKAYADDY